MILSRLLRAQLAATLLALPLAAQGPVACAVKDLPTHAFVANDVSLTVNALSGYKAFDRERKFAGRARVEFTVVNTSAAFRRFDPQDLCLVGKDGVQVFPVFERNLADDTQPMPLRLAPGARATREYALSGRLAFPAKVYFGEALVAEVSE
ncbi:MAG: hypothetical protein U0P81_06950 [Holophagaceae bacterium]